MGVSSWKGRSQVWTPQMLKKTHTHLEKIGPDQMSYCWINSGKGGSGHFDFFTGIHSFQTDSSKSKAWRFLETIINSRRAYPPILSVNSQKLISGNIFWIRSHFGPDSNELFPRFYAFLSDPEPRKGKTKRASIDTKTCRTSELLGGQQVRISATRIRLSARTLAENEAPAIIIINRFRKFCQT